MHIDKARPEDAVEATAVMVAAFAEDALLAAFFDDSPMGRDAASARFFGLLLDARLALAMPALILRQNGIIAGVAMGYDTTRPDWPAALDARWDALLADHPGLAARFAAYDAVTESAALDRQHYYLGALAVRPGLQGRGLGRALTRAFLDLSAADPASEGTSLETAEARNCRLYEGFGFVTRAEGPVGAAHVRCMFCPKESPWSA